MWLGGGRYSPGRFWGLAFRKTLRDKGHNMIRKKEKRVFLENMDPL